MNGSIARWHYQSGSWSGVGGTMSRELALVVGLLTALALGGARSACGPRPRASLAQGDLCGLRADDGDYDMFLGIPYAKVSDPQHRFQSVYSVPTWDSPLDASRNDVMCMQKSYNGTVVGSIDCLVANVYVPRGAAAAPVLLFIHGGGYRSGSGNAQTFGPRRLVARGVLVVTFNYRLGSLGFLCLRERDAPGNAGLKDAVRALRWVHDNIAHFGGDPDAVTVFGQSSGAVNVEALVLSPAARGLFRGAIMQSGSVLSEWAFNRNAERRATAFARFLGVTSDDPAEIAKALREIPAEQLVRAEPPLVGVTLPFAPCVEKELPGVEPVVTLSPRDMSIMYPVPVMVGFNTDEGMIIYRLLKSTPHLEKALKGVFKELLPPDLPFATPAERQRAAERVSRFYVGGRPPSVESIGQLVQLTTDRLYSNRIVWSATSAARASATPVYLYEFAYDGGLPFYKRRLGITDIPGVCHADELGYLFQQGSEAEPIADADQLMIDRLTTLWTNFAKFGDPTPSTDELLPVKWEPITADCINCLRINSTMSLVQNPYKERMELWNDIYEGH